MLLDASEREPFYLIFYEAATFLLYPRLIFQGKQNRNRGRFLKDLPKKISSLTLDFYLKYIN